MNLASVRAEVGVDFSPNGKGLITAALLQKAFLDALNIPSIALALAPSQNIPALYAYDQTALFDGAVVPALGFATAGDGGGGNFIWSASSTAIDNGASIINPTGNTGPGRFLRDVVNKILTPLMFGAKSTPGNVVDDTAALIEFASLGGGLLPPGYVFGVSGYITLSMPGTMLYSVSQQGGLKYLPSTGASQPLLWAPPANSGGVHLVDFSLDANATNLGMPTLAQANPLAGSAIILGCSNSSIQGLAYKNTFDDGIALSNLDLVAGTYGPAGFPQNIQLIGNRSANCGCGVHTSGALLGKNGAAIDIASAQAVTVDDHIDNGSYGAIGNDTGGGAAFNNIQNSISYNCKLDVANPTNGSGNAFVLQASQSSIVNCKAFAPGLRGLWVSASPAGLEGIQIADFYVEYAGGNGYEISGSANATNLRCLNSGQLASGTYDNFRISTVFASISSLQVLGLSSSITDGKAAYDYREQTATYNGTALTVSAQIIGATISSKVSYGTGTTFLGGTDPLIQVDPSTGNINIGGSASSYLALLIASPRDSGVWLQGQVGSSLVKSQSYTNGNSNLQLSGTGTGLIDCLSPLQLASTPTSASGLATGQVWRDTSTTPNTLRIV